MVPGSLGQIITVTADGYDYGPWASFSNLLDNYEEHALPAYQATGYPLEGDGTVPEPQAHTTPLQTEYLTRTGVWEMSNSLGAHAAQVFPHLDAGARACAVHHAAYGENGGQTGWDPGDPCDALTGPGGSGSVGPGLATVAVGDSSAFETFGPLTLLADTYTARAFQGRTDFSLHNFTTQASQCPENVAAQLPAFWEYWWTRPLNIPGTGYVPVQFRRTRVDVQVRMYAGAVSVAPRTITNGFTVTGYEDDGSVDRLDMAAPNELGASMFSLAADGTAYTAADLLAGAIPHTTAHRWDNVGGPTLSEALDPLFVFPDTLVFDNGFPSRFSSSRVEAEADIPAGQVSLAEPWIRYETWWYGQYRLPRAKGFPPLRQIQTRGWHSSSPAGNSPLRVKFSPRQTGYF